MVTCMLCLRELDNNKGLSYHLSQTHNVKFCDYLVKFEHNGVWPTCACGCGEKVSFFGGKFSKSVGKHCAKGYKHTQKTRENMSKSQRGKKLSEEHKANIRSGVKNAYSKNKEISASISTALLNKQKSESHKQKISETRKKRIEQGQIVIAREKISEKITQRYLDGGFEWAQGQYHSRKGDTTYNYRSSWELELMTLLDEDDGVTLWKYEPLSVPYQIEGVTRRYIPDFYILYRERDFLVEVKPASLSDTKTNAEKRKAALELCEKNGWSYAEWQSGESLSALLDMNII